MIRPSARFSFAKRDCTLRPVAEILQGKVPDRGVGPLELLNEKIWTPLGVKWSANAGKGCGFSVWVEYVGGGI